MILLHPFEPIYNRESRVLILGSFPSVKSRENSFYYGNPHNRFWRIISKITNTPMPIIIDDKKNILLNNNIALWDVLKSCEIEGSADSSIKNPIPNNISKIVSDSKISAIYFNGNKANDIFYKHIKEKPDIKTFTLPSTSPANARYSFERLLKEWMKIKV